jgi:hypothetical protein
MGFHWHTCDPFYLNGKRNYSTVPDETRQKDLSKCSALQITPLPGAWPLKPGSATLPFFGVEPAIVDEHGKEMEVRFCKVGNQLNLFNSTC